MKDCRLTDKYIKAISASTKLQFYWDKDLKGFGVQVTPRGIKSFVVTYRATGHQNRTVIAKCDFTSTTGARAKAKKILVDAHEGIDFHQERQKERKAPRLKDLVEDYFEGHWTTKAPKSQREDQKLIYSHLLIGTRRKCVFNSKRLTEITKNDVLKIRQKLSKTPVQFNRLRSLLSKMFNIAQENGWINRNPVKGVPLFKEEAKERYIPMRELERVFKYFRACEGNDLTFSRVALLMLHTGCRKGEALKASWDQFDFKNRVWLIPNTKTGDTKRKNFNHEWSEVLQGMKAQSNSKYLFPSNRSHLQKGASKDAHFTDIKNFWNKVRDALWKGTDNYSIRIYDLRHTYASVLASEGVGLDTVGLMLGHKDRKSTARYAHLYPEKRLEVADTIGKALPRFNP